MTTITDICRRALHARLVRAAAHMADCDLEKSAVVFAPHPDDETLGCGGTIALKVRAGAEVNALRVKNTRRLAALYREGHGDLSIFCSHDAVELDELEAIAACEEF